MHVESTTILPLINFKQQSVTNIRQQHNPPSAWIITVLKFQISIVPVIIESAL